METFEEELDLLFNQYDSLKQWKERAPVAYRLFREKVTTDHQVEMDRVVDELLQDRSCD